jgi:hypothetical protein
MTDVFRKKPNKCLKLGGVCHCFAWQGTHPCVNCSLAVINQNKIFTHFYIFYVEHNNFILIITPIYKSEECLHHAAHNWVVWIRLSNLEQSALFWHQAVGYSVGKIDVSWKTFDKVRGKIVKIIKIFEKLEYITHFGSKIIGHLLCRHSISYIIYTWIL